MLYGINYKTGKKYDKGLKIDEKLDVYFENPVSALKSAEELEIIADGAFDFFVFESEKEAGKGNLKIAKSFEQFNDEYLENACDALVQSLDELSVYNLMSNFKNHFDAMSPSEQDEYLIKMGLKFKPQEEPKEKE